MAVPHLPQCPACWERAGRVVSGLRDEGRPVIAPSEAGRAVLVLFAQEEEQALARLRARGRWAELRRLSGRQQLGRIEADPALRTPEMVRAMLEGAAGVAPEDPLLGEETALVAHALAGILPGDRHPEPFRNGLQGEALVAVADCRRRAGNWRESASALAEARRHLQRGTGEPAREARLLTVEASLAADMGRPELALDLLPRASALYREARDEEEAASVTVQEADLLLKTGRPEEAIDRAEEALRRLPPGAALSERLARNVLSEGLLLLGRPGEALRNLRTAPGTGCLEALLLDALEHPREAEKAFRSHIAACLEAERYPEAFRTMLAQLETLFRRGAWDKAARVCREALDRIGPAGEACHPRMAELWRNLLARAGARSLTEPELLAARQSLVRHGNAPPPRKPHPDPLPSPSLPPGEGAPSPLETAVSLLARGKGERWERRAGEVRTPGGYKEALELYDRDLVEAGLARCGGRVRETSRLLGISRNTLRGKIRKYGLAAGEPEPPPAKPDEEAERELRRLRARAWWAELKTLPQGTRTERLRTISSLRTREMLDLLMEEASAVALNDPHQGERTALLAHTLAGLLPRCPEPSRNDLQGAALLVVANSRRLAGDWPGSAAALRSARSHLSRGTGEPAREARLLSIEASLGTDTGHTEESLALLEHAARLYRKAQDPVAVASVTIQAAGTLMASGRHEEALSRAEEALRLLPTGEDRLCMLARNVTTESLAHLGRPAEALRSFIASEVLYDQRREQRTGLRLGFLEAVLLDALGHIRESELIFQSLITDFMEAELYKDAFLTMLTQFVSLVRRGDLDRAARACEEALERIEEAGVEGHGPMKELWRGLLTLVNARRLTESHLLEARHQLVRYGNAPEPDETEMDGLPPADPGGPAALVAPPDPAASLAEVGYEEALRHYDRQLVAAALAQSQGRIAETCRRLGISRNQLRSKVRQYFLSMV